MAQIKQWLSSDKFPSLQESQANTGGLGAGSIGTDDTAVIDKDITPPQRPSLMIIVRWKDYDPGDSVRVHSLSTTSVQEKVTQYNETSTGGREMQERLPKNSAMDVLLYEREMLNIVPRL